jgi:Na+/H+ antiporter NhaD/arsenite permease-like protein
MGDGIRWALRALGGGAAWLSALWAAPADAAVADGAPAIDGAQLELIWGLPFVGLLLSIAILPLAAPKLWHRHFGKIAAAWALAFLAPFAVRFGIGHALYEVAHIGLLEYLPFVLLLLALFTVGGGVQVVGALRGTPATNTAVLAIGTALASWMGTTGAAMLLIHPLIRANLARRYNVHVFVFFILLVGNIGGALTPLGDPPLFIGFLKGVDFFWTAKHMLAPMLVLTVLLLAVFFLLDTIIYRREPKAKMTGPTEPIRLEGTVNIALLAAVIGAVLISGVWHSGVTFTVLDIPLDLEDLLRAVLLLVLTGLSWRLTPAAIRQANAFSWAPMAEVAKLFAGIFITIVPAIAILKAGGEGAARPLIELLNRGGAPDVPMYFWVTGVLSSFLDNAPTYLVFFNIAGGDAALLMGPLAPTLLAISAGSVFMGALTYIGNAPNFMIKAVAEQRGIAMPSFFGFMGWAALFLLPGFALLTVIFFR